MVMSSFSSFSFLFWGSCLSFLVVFSTTTTASPPRRRRQPQPQHQHHSPRPVVAAFGVGTTKKKQTQKQTQSIEDTPVVICPGFGNDSIDYETPLEQERTVGLVSGLERRGFQPENIYIVPVKRYDWIRVGGGLFDIPDFYRNQAKPTGFGYGWYVKRVQETITQAYQESNQQNKKANGTKKKVLIIGHSAGGWLARAAMGDGTWSSSPALPEEEEESNDEETVTTTTSTITKTSDLVTGLVTIGAIHRVPQDATKCVTKGALAYTDQNYPGAYLAPEGIAYVTVGGDAVVGNNSKEQEEEKEDISSFTDTTAAADDLYAKRGEGSAARVAYTSYEAVCGNGNGITGDGVVPLEWTKLEGATTLVLPNVVHSINEAGTTLPSDRWYGSENILDQWLPTVLQAAQITTTSSNNNNDDDDNVLNNVKKWAQNIF